MHSVHLIATSNFMRYTHQVPKYANIKISTSIGYNKKYDNPLYQ